MCKIKFSIPFISGQVMVSKDRFMLFVFTVTHGNQYLVIRDDDHD